MHMQGDPRTMQADPAYDDVVDDVKAFLSERIEVASAAGVATERIWLDPGIGFGKTLEHNLELLRRLDELRGLGRPPGRRHLAQELHRQDRRLRRRGPDRRHDRLLASSPPPRAPTCSESTTSPRSPRPSGSRPRSSGRFSCDGGPRQRNRVERRGRDPQPLDLHPPWGQRRRAGGRAAARVRHHLRRPRLRRGAHRPDRGHGRLRRGLRHRRPRRHRAQLPDPRAPRPGRRNPPDGALQLRIGPGPRREARAAAAAGDPGGRRRGRRRNAPKKRSRTRRSSGCGPVTWASVERRRPQVPPPRRGRGTGGGRGRGRGGLLRL